MKDSIGIKGKRVQERIEPSEINDDFVVDFPLTTAQKKVIEIVYTMRAVKMSQLVEITGYNYQYLARQILPLYINRFLERMFPQKDREKPGSEESYYLLDQAGAIFISGYYEIPMKNVVWNRRDNLVKYEKLNHTFQINGVRARIEKIARDKKHKIVNCVSDRHLYLAFEYEGNKLALRPDMFFQYIDNERQYSYFVEVDLGTMAITANSDKTDAFANKVQYYEAYRLSGAYRENYSVFPRVLVITTTIDRAEKLLEAVREKQQKTNIEFLFTSFTLWNEGDPAAAIFKDTNGNYRSMFN